MTYLTSDGALTSYIRNGTAWTSGQPSLAKESTTSALPTFTAIAAAQDMKMYAITNGTIYEYDVDDEDPLSWELLSTVFTSS